MTKNITTTSSSMISFTLMIASMFLFMDHHGECCTAFQHQQPRGTFPTLNQPRQYQRSSFIALPIGGGGVPSSILSSRPHHRHPSVSSSSSSPGRPQQRSSSSSTTTFATTTQLLALPAAAATTASAAAASSPSSSSFLVSLASSPVGAITVLAGIVLIHEAGHYLAARSFNITVDEFAIGFGPKLVGFAAFGNEFNIRLLPLGGYVRFPENFNSTRVSQQQRTAQLAFQERKALENWSLGQTIANEVTFGYWDDQRRKKVKKEKAAAALTATTTALSPTTWWQRFGSKKQQQSNPKNNNIIIDPEDYEIEYYTDPNLLQNRPWTERAVVLSMGVIFNLLLSFSIYFGTIGVGGGLPTPIFDSGVVVTAAPMPNGPSVGLLQQGDIITSINGK
jgi:hypothetical protein